MTHQPASLPRVGMLATVRNRRAVITGVDGHDGGPAGRYHLVRLEFADGEGSPDAQLIWELEPRATLLEQNALPLIGSSLPMEPRHFDAVVRSARWTAVSPFIDPDGKTGVLEANPVAAPFHGAVQVEDFQLVPLIKALRMPRIALLLADDVGLGKTIEAGLILTELLIRRRAQRVLIICPASLQGQWQKEMRSKFCIECDIVDRDRTHALRRRLGLDANSWRSSPRIITSYHYLKQPDVLAEFNAAFRHDPNSPHLPWDLLVVDEAHNLSPAPFGEDSALTKMLRLLTAKFEHRLFLTATPHNGHTTSFSGLLEMLDPVRFSMRDEFSPAEKARVADVLVRRLKREINARTNPPRFAERLPPEGLMIQLDAREAALSEAFNEFRSGVRSVIAASSRTGRLAGWFAVEILGKRLLSCPLAFAQSWQRVRAGIEEEVQVDDGEVLAVERITNEETSDDREAEGRVSHASKTIGSWLKPLAAQLIPQIRQIDLALSGLGLLGEDFTSITPKMDARVDALINLIESRLRRGGEWRDDERLVVFTEYKTTLDYLERRLLTKFGDTSRFALLFGGMDENQREPVKDAFNDPANPIRVLLATDAASEGLNLQETARYIMHFDVPWNPARLEQRNGRLDRHGQARDVSVFHFVSDQDADMQFLAHVVNKLHHIREDLGSTGELFDEAIHRRLVEGQSATLVQMDLDTRVKAAKGRADVPRDDRVEVREVSGEAAGDSLRGLAAELDLDPQSLCETLEVALSVGGKAFHFDMSDPNGRLKFRPPLPTEWEPTIDSSLRLSGTSSAKGPLPALVFDPDRLVDSSKGRPVFRPRLDTVLMHLSHPLYQRALTALARARFPGEESNKATRWTIRRSQMPPGVDALVLLTIEELGINELREPFHHWTRTIVYPVKGGELGVPMPHATALSMRLPDDAFDPTGTKQAREIWSELNLDLKAKLKQHGTDLTQEVKTELEARRIAALKTENDRFVSRQGEVSELIARSTLLGLEKEITRLRSEKRQGMLYDSQNFLDEIDRSLEAKQEELKRRTEHYEELREQLRLERERVISRIIPKRYALRGEVQVFPVSVEIRLPEAQNTGGSHE